MSLCLNFISVSQVDFVFFAFLSLLAQSEYALSCMRTIEIHTMFLCTHYSSSMRNYSFMQFCADLCTYMDLCDRDEVISLEKYESAHLKCQIEKNSCEKHLHGKMKNERKPRKIKTFVHLKHLPHKLDAFVCGVYQCCYCYDLYASFTMQLNMQSPNFYSKM